MSKQVKTFFPAKVKVGTKETDWVCEMIQCPGDCGEYVLESDYAALAAEVERLKQPWVKILTESETWNALSEVARLTAENERLRKAGEWQPIGTAPKDGTHILTCEDGYIVVAMWFVYHGGRSQWETVDGESEIDPTHWMPLPAAHAAKEGGRK